MGLKGFQVAVALWAIISIIASPFSIEAADAAKLLSAESNILKFSSLNRRSFPAGFVFGTASSAYQYEGAARIDGKGPGIWDTFTQKHPVKAWALKFNSHTPEKIKDRSSGDVAVDEYHHHKEDVRIMKDMNLDAYRFSISWSRILPKGNLSGGINPEGVKYYNSLINELLAKGMTPFVTLFHFDPPQGLEDEYGGFLSPHIVKDYADYAELCFKEFGDRVKHWITLNEPSAFSMSGYGDGSVAPGHCSTWLNPNCSVGDSGTEPYLVSHYQLLAHASAVQLYKTKYQESQKGLIGITLVAAHWFIPLSQHKQSHRRAAVRALDFMLGWFMEPMTRGEYPKSMQTLVGSRLPIFTEEERRLVRGSYDFVGINYYTSYYAFPSPKFNASQPNVYTDARVNQTAERNGIPIGPRAASEWLYVYPRGIMNLLLYIKAKYNNPLIFITENGFDEYNDPTLPLEEALMDTFRIDYHYRHLYYLRSAIKDGVNVKGYFAWSFLDNFEWTYGYTVRFGINFVDYKDGLKRYHKLSALWFKDFLQ